jgi:superfamily I DNA/RNA helicase/CRISPR/Cas system-associated exonuclease Cas4 (RecB family)
MISYLHSINYFENIFQKKGSYIVLGGPGTGKTLFLKELIVYLTENCNVDPAKILVLTFNRRSSKYLRDEIAVKADKTVPEIEVKTFYSFCLDFFKEHTPGSGFLEDIFFNNLNEIKILTAPEQWNLLTDIIMETDEKKIPVIKKLFLNKNTSENIVQEIFDYILRAQENFRKSSELFSKFNPYSNKMLYEINTIYAAFNSAMKDKNVFNYGKLLIDTFSMLNSDSNLKQRCRQKYEFIIVDELQELNSAQYSLLEEISDDNIIYFGDDDQSVYKFRGSNINIFFDVFESIPPERKIFLRNNYRNSYPVMEIIENFISKNSLRINKNSGHDNKDDFNRKNFKDMRGGEVIIKSFENRYEELNFIKSKILMLNRISGIPLNEIAVIMKGTDFENSLIENYFYQNSIPFFRRSSRSVANNRYSAYLLNICYLIIFLEKEKQNNDKAEEDKEKNGLNSKINSLTRNIFLSEFVNSDPVFFKETEFQYHKSAIRKKYMNLYEYLEKNLKVIKKADEKNYLMISSFISAVDRHKKNLNKDAYTFARCLIEDDNFGLSKVIKNYGALSQNDKNLFSIFTNFLTSIRNFCSERESDNDIICYLDFIERFKSNQFIEETEEALAEGNDGNGVRMLSFYECKNFEFEAVFIPFLNKGYLPSLISKPQIYENDFLTFLVEGRFFNEEEIKHIHLENERRILYSGLSRCKNYLYITSGWGHLSSPFFTELAKILSENKKTDEIIPGFSDSGFSLGELLKVSENSLVRKKAMTARYKADTGRKTDRTRYALLLNHLKSQYNPSTWWNIAAEKQNDLNPFEKDKNTGYFSFSAIDTYDDCPFKYKMKYFLKLRTEEENMSLRIGSLYHNIISRFFKKDQKPALQELLKIMGEELENNKDDFKYHFYFKEIKNEMNKNFINLYNNFSYIIDDPDYENLKDKIFTEKEFVFDIDGKNKIKGKIDLINLRDDGFAELIDFKSSQKKYSEKDLEEELQLKIYYLAIKKSNSIAELLPDIRNRTILPRYYVIGLEKYNFFTVTVHEKTEEMVTEKILSIISNIKKEKFDINPRNYFSCSSCEYKIFCEKYYGEPL